MAKRENLKNINNASISEKHLQEKELEEKKRERQRKENLKIILQDCKYFLTAEFKERLRINGSNFAIILQSKESKEEMKEKMEESIKINGNLPFSREITMFFEENYIKILSKVKKEIEAEEIAAIYLENEKQEAEAERQKKEVNYDIIAKIILIIFFFPIFIIGALIYGICKNSK